MIIQAYQTFTEFNQTGMSAFFTYPASIVPLFIPLTLFSIFWITLLATYFSQRRLTTRGDFFASFAVAGWFVCILAFIMSLTEGLINGTTIMICLVVAVIGTILLLISQK